MGCPAATAAAKPQVWRLETRQHRRREQQLAAAAALAAAGQQPVAAGERADRAGRGWRQQAAAAGT
jgi:hypothetical protein